MAHTNIEITVGKICPMSIKTSNEEGSTSLSSSDWSWKFLPIAFVMCAFEMILAGVNILSSPSDTVYGVLLVTLGSALAIFGCTILYSSQNN